MPAVWKKGQVQGEVRPLYGAPVTDAASPSEVAAVAPAPAPPPEAVVANAPADPLAQHVRLLNRVVTELVRERQRLLTELRPDLLDLALSIAREVVGHEAQVDAAVVEHSLSQALQRLHFASRVLVRVHPEDHAHLLMHPEVWQAQGRELELVADETIDRGGCYLESDRSAGRGLLGSPGQG